MKESVDRTKWLRGITHNKKRYSKKGPFYVTDYKILLKFIYEKMGISLAKILSLDARSILYTFTIKQIENE